MKIAYVGHLLEKSGWGRANREYIKALYECGAEITCLPVMLGKAAEVTEEFSFIKDLLKKDIGQPDYIIQHVLPYHMQYSGLYKKNVGFGIVETENLQESIIPDYLNLMDEVWVPNSRFIDEVDVPMKTIPHPVNIAKFSEEYPRMKINEIDHTYKFYTICENSRRKNIWSTIRSYFRAFGPSDNVSLIIKVYDNQKSPEELKSELERNLESCKKNCRLSDYPEVVFITDYFPNDQLMAFHKYCDCYVSSSFGEAWCYPISDALGFGSRVISSETAGASYMYYNTGCLIDLVMSGCTQPYHGELDCFHGYHTLLENCEQTDEIDFAEKMSNVYNQRNEFTKDNLSERNLNCLKGISHKNVGERMMEALCER